MCLIEDQSWIDCIDITSRWDTFVLFHLYGNKGLSLPLWPIRPRWFHTYSPCAKPLRDGHEGIWARFGSQGSIALNWHSRYSGTRYSGTWLYNWIIKINGRETVFIMGVPILVRQHLYIDGLVQERHKSIVNSLESRLSYTNQSILSRPTVVTASRPLDTGTHPSVWSKQMQGWLNTV